MVDTGIGYFGDARLEKNGQMILQRVAARQEVCVRKLGDDRSEHAKIRRFLKNESVTVEEMVAHRAMLTAAAVNGRHVLAIQDTSEINYQAQSGRKHDLGTVGNGSDVGLFVHPVLAIDADNAECLGLVDAQIWRRTTAKAPNYQSLPIEQKESYRWVQGGERAKAVLKDAAMVTIVDDREGDIYEKWARLPDDHSHLLTRACRDRNLVGGGQLFATLAALAEAHRYRLELPARPGKRAARTAHLAVRFGGIRIRRPKNCSDAAAPAEVTLSAVEVRELEAPANEEPVLWRLLTTHPVESVAQALQVIDWYRLRWNIEQVFRTLKRQGLGLEQSVIEDGAALEKLAAIALVGATMTMQMVLARTAADLMLAEADSRPTADDAQVSSPSTPPPASRVFEVAQIRILHALQKKLQGRTKKQQNPYPTDSLAWASWTIARLGGWTGYNSDKSTGPITMRDGLQRFNAIVVGYQLAQDVCPS